MPLWVKEIFCEWLPGILMMKRPEDDESEKDEEDEDGREGVGLDGVDNGQGGVLHNGDDLNDDDQVPESGAAAAVSNSGNLLDLAVGFEGVEVRNPAIPPLPPPPGEPPARWRHLPYPSIQNVCLKLT